MSRRRREPLTAVERYLQERDIDERIQEFMSLLGPWWLLYPQALRHIDLHSALFNDGDHRRRPSNVEKEMLELFDIKRTNNNNKPFDFRTAIVHEILWAYEDPYSYNTCLSLIVTYFTIEVLSHDDGEMVFPLEWQHIRQDRPAIDYSFFKSCMTAWYNSDDDAMRRVYSLAIDQLRYEAVLKNRLSEDVETDELTDTMRSRQLLDLVRNVGDSIDIKLRNAYGDYSEDEMMSLGWRVQFIERWLYMDLVQVGCILTEDQWDNARTETKHWPSIIENTLEGILLQDAKEHAERLQDNVEHPHFNKLALKYTWVHVAFDVARDLDKKLGEFDANIPELRKYTSDKIADDMTTSDMQKSMRRLHGRRQQRVDEQLEEERLRAVRENRDEQLRIEERQQQGPIRAYDQLRFWNAQGHELYRQPGDGLGPIETFPIYAQEQDTNVLYALSEEDQMAVMDAGVRSGMDTTEDNDDDDDGAGLVPMSE
jgi:hypothetical protein